MSHHDGLASSSCKNNFIYNHNMAKNLFGNPELKKDTMYSILFFLSHEVQRGHNSVNIRCSVGWTAGLLVEQTTATGFDRLQWD